MFSVDKANGAIRILSQRFDVWKSPETKDRKPISEGHRTFKSAEAVVREEHRRDSSPSCFSIVETQTIQRVVRVIHP